MTNVTETPVWAVSVKQLDTPEFVLGGPSGPANTAAQQLANRTSYLKVEVEKRAMLAHIHAVGDTTGLQAALDGKASAVHVHVIGDVTGLQAALDGKAAAAHVHGVATISGLQSALDAKANLSHSHSTGDVFGLDAALAGKAPNVHGHTTGNVAGLDAALAGKAATSHTHSISETSGLQAVLDAKAEFAVKHTVTGSRQGGTNYTNSTGKPIFVSVTAMASSSSSTLSLLIDGLSAGDTTVVANGYGFVSGIVPPGSTHTVSPGPGITITRWFETY